MALVALVTIIALLEYTWFGVEVARARSRFGVSAPATTGDPTFERYFRVQQNTTEQLLVFLPAVWLAGYFVHGTTAAALGLVFVIGRALYARGYVQAAEKRGTGFIVGEIASVLLLIIGLVGAIAALF
jgi:uncharacterized membrane protein YecN with MAPEG domain